MRLAGHTLGTPEQTVPEALALFAAAGLDAAEVIYQDDYRSGLPLRDRRTAEQARRASDDTGIPIVGLTPYTTGINALDDGPWRTAVDEFRGAIEIAQIVGADRLRVYAGSWHPGDHDHATHWDRLVEALRTLAPEASAAGKPPVSVGKKKLSYLEAREYAGIESAVEAAEERLQAARTKVEDPVVATDAAKLTAALAEMEAAQEEADCLYARWAELTEKAG